MHYFHLLIRSPPLHSTWRVVLHTGPTPERWYVSKAGHEVLLVTGPYTTDASKLHRDLLSLELLLLPAQMLFQFEARNALGQPLRGLFTL